MHPRTTSRALASVFVCLMLGAAQASEETRPPEGIRSNPPRAHALLGARIVLSPDRTLDAGVLLVADGKFVAVGPEASVPEGFARIDVSGRTILPGWIDGYSESPTPTSAADAGAPYWNDEIRPQVRVLDHFRGDGRDASLRKAGFVARLVAPATGILRGRAALLTTSSVALAERVLVADAATAMRLRPSGGRGRSAYPNSPMGAVALARQAFLDAAWYQSALGASRADASLSPPKRDDALESLADLSGGERLTIAVAPDDAHVLRADRFAREFSLRLAVLGSGLEYRRLDAVQTTRRPIILPLDFPRPPNVATPETAAEVSLRELLHWDLAPENPARLIDAGVEVALTTFGHDDPGAFLTSLRKAVSRGLSKDDALRALTVTPARLFGVESRLGTIEPGKDASFIVVDGDPFEDGARIEETWIAGERERHAPSPMVDARGEWTLHLSGGPAPSIDLVLEGEPLQLRGRLVTPGTPDETPPTDSVPPESATGADAPDPEADPSRKLLRVSIRGRRLAAAFDAATFGKEGVARLSATLVGDAGEIDEWLGSVAWPDGTTSELTARRRPATPPPEDAEPTPESPPTAGASVDASPAEAPPHAEAPAEPLPSPVLRPLGAFGRLEPPSRPRAVLVRGATVWTCSAEGVLEDASVLFGDGRVIAVGRDLAAPSDALVIDGRGKHVTPGIIDCHSHMATDGGINESGQAITAEVRIGDFIDADDITIYRQLAGGVTAANILHGSANPIGGQNQVIKLRWGALGEELVFREAPAGIKFALGENVKQSNWGDDFTTRYPQTRMGVEQIIRDAFQAAAAYAETLASWRADPRGAPPRRDLELETLVEILRHERLVHCHSYRQDEILALVRTLDELGVRIGTFQHVLEGYKVADELARHGAGASAFSDWWAYKFEVYDAIPFNGALMHQAGVVVSFNSDDRELGRHLNHEAAKAVKYGGVPPEEALKFVTLNPAKQLGVDEWVGSLAPGKHADLVIWSGPPLALTSRCEQTWIDGSRYFDLEEDRQARREAERLRTALIQKVLASKEAMLLPGERRKEERELWARDDEFCRAAHHDHGEDGDR